MPGVVRIDDNCSGHGCWPPRPSITGSPDVFVNNKQVERYNDVLEEHCCRRIIEIDGEIHIRTYCHDGLHLGIRDVFVNELPIQVGQDPISCGSVCDECSDNVFAE
jgi:hypothetical protein